MKKLFAPLAVLLVATAFTACYKKTDCQTPLLRKAVFYSNSSTVFIDDTSAYLIKGSKGSLFNRIADTLYYRLDGKKTVYFPDGGAETYDYDWKFVLLPSLKEYRIQKLEHQDNNTNGGLCTSTVSYTVNDSLVSKTGNPYSSTPYETPDIMIKW